MLCLFFVIKNSNETRPIVWKHVFSYSSQTFGAGHCWLKK